MDLSLVAQIIYSVACLIFLIVLCLCFRMACGYFIFLCALVIPAMSHVYHILFDEGSLENGDAIWNTYEVAVFLEVLILRLITTVTYLRWRWCIAAIVSLAGAAAAFVLPFGYGGRVYDWTALGLDVVLIAVSVWSVNYRCRRQNN